MWGNTFPPYRSKLHRLQNKAIRIVAGNNWNETAAPLYQVFKILPLFLLFQFSKAKFVYFHSRLRLPLQFDNYFTSSKSVHSRTIRRVARNLQWEECFGGLGAKPPAAGGTWVWGRSPQRSKFCNFLQK